LFILKDKILRSECPLQSDTSPRGGKSPSGIGVIEIGARGKKRQCDADVPYIKNQDTDKRAVLPGVMAEAADFNELIDAI
jgi:hypothetical protein